MGVHPDNTAWRAVDACGGIYTPAEEASGFAAGHRAALASAVVSVGHADGITAALLAAIPDLTSVIAWLRNGCEINHAVTELEIYQARIDTAKARATQSPATEGGAS